MGTKHIHIMVVGAEALDGPDLPLTEIYDEANANLSDGRYLLRMARNGSLRQMRSEIIDTVIKARAKYGGAPVKIEILDLVGHGKGGQLELNGDTELTISSIATLDSIARFFDRNSRVRLLGCNVGAMGAARTPFHGPSLKHGLHLMFEAPIGAPKDGLQIGSHFTKGWLNEAGEELLTYWPGEQVAQRTTVPIAA